MPLADMVNKYCEDCKYFKNFENEEFGTTKGSCHRYPPLIVYAFNEIETTFPTVSGYDYCGEWKK